MNAALELMLGALPALVLMVFFYLKDRYEPEPHGHVAAAFGLGVLAFGASFYAGTALAGLVDPVWLALGGLPAHLFEAGVLAGGVEEVAKFLLMWALVMRWDEFDEPLDGLIYGVAVALGLAAVENVLYVHRLGLEGGMLRAVLSVPAHALFGAAMGTQFGRAKLGRGRHEASQVPRGERRRALAAALLIPLGFHTAYDLSLLELRGPLMYGAVVGLSALLWAYVLRQVRLLQHDSPFRGARDVP